jgi:lysophospholipase L1-like esterase
MLKRTAGTFGIVLCGCLVSWAEEPKKDSDRFARWEKEIVAIEGRLQKTSPAKDAIAFAGSSTIRMWDLTKSFPDLDVHNCGFGGSEIRDVTHFAERILLPSRPKVIVFYAGDNDLNSQRTPEQVCDDFQAFAVKVHMSLPKTKIIFLSIKPSPARWKLVEKQKKANQLVAAFCKKNEQLEFLDIFQLLLGEDGMPNPQKYAKDNLHLSPKGYEELNKAVSPLLK